MPEENFEEEFCANLSMPPKLVWRWRVILRMSFDNDQSSKLRQSVSNMLNSCGIMNTGTGIWESKAVTANKAASKLSEVLKMLANKTEEAGSKVRPDHIWVYIDKVPQP